MTVKKTSLFSVSGAFIALSLAIAGVSSCFAQVVALGASNVQGYGVSPSEAFPAQLQAMLRAKGRNYSVANAGINGDTTVGVLSRLDTAVPQATRIVVLNIGGNDLLRGGSLEQVRTNFAQIASRLKARGIRVINANPYVRTAIQQGMVQGDGIHLTAEGHRFVAARVASAIR